MVFQAAASRDGRRHRGHLIAGATVVPCSIGRTGVRAAKREGDGATPLGSFRLSSLRYRPDKFRLNSWLVRSKQIKLSSGWCDDIGNSVYNREVSLPFGGRHERLWREDSVYDVVLLLDHNQTPRVKGFGSAIFLHLSNEMGGPTEGCIAISAVNMRRLLPRLGRHPVLTIR